MKAGQNVVGTIVREGILERDERFERVEFDKDGEPVSQQSLNLTVNSGHLKERRDRRLWPLSALLQRHSLVHVPSNT